MFLSFLIYFSIFNTFPFYIGQIFYLYYILSPRWQKINGYLDPVAKDSTPAGISYFKVHPSEL